MTVRKSVELRDLGRVFRRQAKVVVATSAQATRLAFVQDFYVLGVRATPVGTLGKRKPGGKAGDPGHGTSEHPGYLRGSLNTSAGRAAYKRRPPTVFNPLPDASRAEAVVRRAKPESNIFLTYGAPYAPSIEAGLRTRRGRRYGSPQAPQGWVLVSSRRILSSLRGGSRIKAEIARRVREAA